MTIAGYMYSNTNLLYMAGFKCICMYLSFWNLMHSNISTMNVYYYMEFHRGIVLRVESLSSPSIHGIHEQQECLTISTLKVNDRLVMLSVMAEQEKCLTIDVFVYHVIATK